MIRKTLQKLLLSFGIGGFFVGVINIVSCPTPILSRQAEYCLELEDLIKNPIFSCSTPEGFRAYQDITQEYYQLSKILPLQREIIKYHESQEKQKNGLLYLGLGVFLFAAGAGLYCLEGDKKRNKPRTIEDVSGLDITQLHYNLRITEKPACIPSLHDELRSGNYLPDLYVRGFEINPRELEKRFRGKN